MRSRSPASWLPRELHPVAWWLWALGLAVAASRTSNPWLLLLIAGVVVTVVAARRSDAPWARGHALYLRLGVLIIGLRVLFRAVFGGALGHHVILRLPSLPLPDWAAGVQVGGVVTVESLLAALSDGLRLAVLLVCIGAANTLANPRRLLRAAPRALHEVGAALTVAVSLAPQIVDSVFRVRRAQRLRGRPARRADRLRRVLVPVLEDAIGRSLALAAAMDVRGYGRVGPATGRRGRSAAIATFVGVGGMAVGLYGFLDGTAPPVLGIPTLAVGVIAAVIGLRMAGDRVVVTRYRPDPWGAPEWAVVSCGAVAAILVGWVAVVDRASVFPPVVPLQWPPLPAMAATGVLAAMLPAWVSPTLPTAAATVEANPDPAVLGRGHARSTA